MIRAFVIDDEPLSVTRMIVLCRRFDDVEIVGTANNGNEALPQIAEQRPEVLFVDIEMPGMDGFDLIEAVAKLEGAAPLIVFVTAFRKFAAEAFDTGAIDFVTKPVRFDRLAACVERIRYALESRLARTRLEMLVQQIDRLRLEGRNESVSTRRYLWVHRRGEAIRVDLDRLDWVSAEAEYVRLFIGTHEYLHRTSISSLFEKLDQARFLRVHRSHIVRIDRISAISRRTTGSYSLALESGVTVPIGRRYRHLIRTIAAEVAGKNR